jgi:hypothetical protein
VSELKFVGRAICVPPGVPMRDKLFVMFAVLAPTKPVCPPACRFCIPPTNPEPKPVPVGCAVPPSPVALFDPIPVVTPVPIAEGLAPAGLPNVWLPNMPVVVVPRA